MKFNDFPDSLKIKWVAGDTETYLYIDGVKVSESEHLKLGREKPQSWIRTHTRVECYAWLISDGVHFAWLETFDEYVEFCCKHKIKSIWWYNAKFDFSIIDYYLLKENWKINLHEDNKDCTFNSLHSDMGARYSLKLWKEWKGRKKTEDRHAHVHSFTNYDFCNIFGGGLKKCLESFNVTDYEGNPIRKLEMDYQGENDVTNADSLQYMKNDVFGLFHLVRIANSWLEENIGYSLCSGSKPDIITAGGLAKRCLLDELYPQGTKRDQIKQFQREHIVDLEIDKQMRFHFLYRGGITFVNPYKQGKDIFQKIYRYDINSMYPAQMKKMPDLYGRPRQLTFDQYKRLKNKKNYVTILEISELRGSVKNGMLGMWYDPYLKSFTECPEVREEDDSMFMFVNEFLEYKNFLFDLTYQIKSVIVIKQRKIDGYEKYVDKFYEMKNEGKRTHDKVKTAFAKLLLNSSYGKLSERPVRPVTHRELTEYDYVHLVKDGEEEDPSSIMSVIQGALVTSMARCSLLKFIREICVNVKENLIYCDTDSVHSLRKYEDADPYEIGKMKEEAICDYGKFLAPKTYIEGEKKERWEYEVHTKGVPTQIVKRLIDDHSPDYASKIFKPGQKFLALSGLNVSGGKALIPLPKTICKLENCTMFNADGEELIEDEGDEGDEENEIKRKS